MVFIKNCGLRTSEAIHAAIESEADFLGFISFAKSPRHIEPEDIKSLLDHLDTPIKTVLVMVDPTDEEINAHLKHWTPSIIQLHGNESLERTAEIKSTFNLPIIKALGVRNREDLDTARSYVSTADYLILDAKDETQKGGTGKAFDWNLLQGFDPQIPWFLSGGLNIDNIEDAIQKTGATFIDVSSGIESERGIKDVAKIIAFNERVKSI